jgi:peptide/nickel transport system permease protein
MRAKKRLWFLGTLLLFVHSLILGAGFFAPYNPAEQNRDLPFAPPMRLRLFDTAGRFHLRPFVYPWIHHTGDGRLEYEEDRSQMWPLRFFVRGGDERSGGALGRSIRLFGVDAPGRVFLFGTDEYGRDQMSRFLYGGQVSLLAGLLATSLSLGLGLILGSIAGYFGRGPDTVVMRGTEVFMALPWLYLLFAVRAFLPLQVGERQAFFLLVAVIGFTGWAGPARLIRGVVLSSKHRDYVLAARGFGASNLYVLRRHVLPETLPVLLTQAALLVPQFILGEVTLSFLGLGVSEPVPSWGSMLARLQKYYVLEFYWWMLAAGLALVPIFLLYHWVADALQDSYKRTNEVNVCLANEG